MPLSPVPPAPLRLTVLSPALGAEVEGLDVASPISDETFAWLSAALQEHHFLCLRGQTLTIDQQIAFSRRFGPLEDFPEEDRTKDSRAVFAVANVGSDGASLPPSDFRVIAQKVNARFHTDSSYRFVPAHASLLYATEALPDEAEGGETEFSNMFAAYDALPQAVKQAIEPLQMVHAYVNGRRLCPEMPPLTLDQQEALPPACHPLVRVHPDRGGRRSLFFSANVAMEVGGLPLNEARSLHRRLEDHVQNPAFCYRHSWRTGDLMMWDNRCVLHRAIPFDVARYRRVAQRTTVAGTGPVLGPFSATAP